MNYIISKALFLSFYQAALKAERLYSLSDMATDYPIFVKLLSGHSENLQIVSF